MRTRPEGLEPPTNRVEAGCSNPLSYGRKSARFYHGQGHPMPLPNLTTLCPAPFA